MNEVNVGAEEGEKGAERIILHFVPLKLFHIFFFKGGCCPRLITFRCAALRNRASHQGKTVQ